MMEIGDGYIIIPDFCDELVVVCMIVYNCTNINTSMQRTQCQYHDVLESSTRS